MVKTVNEVVWALPAWVHELILRLSGWRLVEAVEVVADNKVEHPDGIIEMIGCRAIGEPSLEWMKAYEGQDKSGK